MSIHFKTMWRLPHMWCVITCAQLYTHLKCLGCAFYHLSKTDVNLSRWVVFHSLFQEEISACAAVHTCCVMNACSPVRSIILLLCMMAMSFVLVALTRGNVTEPKHWVTWSHRTGVKFPFLRGKRIQYFSVYA